MTNTFYSQIDPGATFSTGIAGFYSNGVNPVTFSRVNGRAFVGEGADTFAGATRGNNPVTFAWVHSGDEGNEIFAPVASTTLSGAINDSVTTIGVVATTNFAASGHAKIDDEIVAYSGLTSNSLTGVTRGQLGTTAASHLTAASVYRQLGAYGSRSQWAQTSAMLASISDRGLAVSGASRTLRGDAIGASGVARYDAAGVGTMAWATYSEIVRGAGSLGLGSAWGHEIGVMNFAGDPILANRGGTPYRQGEYGQTLGLMVQAGGSSTNAYNADNPIVIAKGSKAFWRGIVIERDAISGVGGARAEALLMPEDLTLTWYAPDEARAFNFFSSIADSAYAQELLVNEFGLSYRHMDGATMFLAEFVASSVNYLKATPSATGGAVLLASAGADTNSNLIASGKGTGKFGFGTWTSNADAAVNGYVTIVDAAGNTRKLATIA